MKIRWFLRIARVIKNTYFLTSSILKGEKYFQAFFNSNQVAQCLTPTTSSEKSQRLDFSNLNEHFKAPSSNHLSSNTNNQKKSATLNYKSDLLPNLSQYGIKLREKIDVVLA